ncbi:unnamed protein product [Diamesa tonsa]
MTETKRGRPSTSTQVENFDHIRPILMKYAVHHNFFGRLTDLMSKCFLQNAQDPFRVIADTIYEEKGINYASKVETLKKDIVTMEEKIKTLEERIQGYETCNALGIAITDDDEEDGIKSAYETFGKSMYDSEDSKSVSETGTDTVMIEKVPVIEINANVAEPMIQDQNSTDDSGHPLYIYENSLDSTKASEKSLNKSNVSFENTLGSSSSIIISDELLELPIISYDEPQINPDLVCHNEIEALIDSISETTVNANNLLEDSETLEIEHALEAIHSSSNSNFNLDTIMKDETIAVPEKIIKKSPSMALDRSLASDDYDFEPDYEDSCSDQD